MNHKMSRTIFIVVAGMFFLFAPFGYMFFVEGRAPDFGTMVAAVLVLYSALITVVSAYQWRLRELSTGMVGACGVSAVASFLLALNITRGPESHAPTWVAARIVLSILLISPSILILLSRRTHSSIG